MEGAENSLCSYRPLRRRAGPAPSSEKPPASRISAVTRGALHPEGLISKPFLGPFSRSESSQTLPISSGFSAPTSAPGAPEASVDGPRALTAGIAATSQMSGKSVTKSSALSLVSLRVSLGYLLNWRPYRKKAPFKKCSNLPFRTSPVLACGASGDPAEVARAVSPSRPSASLAPGASALVAE